MKSDIWSLGCVLYEAAALKPPFQAEDMQTLFKKVVKGVFPPLPSIYSEDFSEVLRHFIIVDPNKRPSAAQILRLSLVNKRVNIREENSENLNSSLLGTIKLPQNYSLIADRLPGSKYHEKSKSEPPLSRTPLPQLVMLNRGATIKHIDDSKHENSRDRYESKYEKPSQIRNILREKYGALKLPRVKYPYHVNSIGNEILSNNIKRREDFLPIQLPERRSQRRVLY